MLLALAIWPTPIPIGHRHSDGLARTPALQWERHLQAYHGGLENAFGGPEDWHWHWVYPGDGYIAMDGEQFAADRQEMLSFEAAFVPAINVQCVEVLSPERDVAISKIPEFRHRSFQSVALLNSRQSLPELLGIMRL